MIWTDVARFFVAGEPRGMPRPRGRIAGRRGGVQWVHIYNPDTADDWKDAIIRVARPLAPARPIVGPVRVDETFFIPRPGRLNRLCDPPEPLPCHTRSDRDNLDKVVLDALTRAEFWGDDQQVCDGFVRKYYHAKDGRPGVWVRVAVPAAVATIGADAIEEAPSLFEPAAAGEGGDAA